MCQQSAPLAVAQALVLGSLFPLRGALSGQGYHHLHSRMERNDAVGAPESFQY
jgi:hypothetical protein